MAEEFETGLVGLVDLVLKFEDVVRGRLLLLLENGLLLVNLYVELSLCLVLSLHVVLLLKGGLELGD